MIPKLTMVIPTFSRSMLLRKALYAISEQVSEELTDKVEVIVLNNASTDDTIQVVTEVNLAFPFCRISVFTNEKNIGGPPNIAKSFTLGSGEFILLLSDDDYLLPGGIRRILDACFKHPKAGYIGINVAGVDPHSGEMIGVHWQVDSTESEIIRFTSPRQGFAFLGTMITFISVMAVRRDLLPANVEEFSKTYFPNSYNFIQVIKKANYGVFISHPVLAMRTGSPTGYAFFDVFVTRFGELVNYAGVTLNDRSLIEKVLIKHVTGYLLFAIAAARISGSMGATHLDWSEGRRTLREIYWKSPTLFFCSLPSYGFTLLPKWACLTIRAARRSLRPRRQSNDESEAYS